MEELFTRGIENAPDASLLFNHTGIRIERPENVSYRREIGERQRLAASPMVGRNIAFAVLEGRAHGKDIRDIAEENNLSIFKAKTAFSADLRLRKWPIDPRTEEPLYFQGRGKTDFGVYSALLQQKIQPPEIQLPEDVIERILTTKRITALGCIALGFLNGEIGLCYNMSTNTAKSQVGSLLKDMGAVDRAHAIGIAFGCGLFKSIQQQQEEMA